MIEIKRASGRGDSPYAVRSTACWFICAKIEPAVRWALMQTLSRFGRLPKRLPASRRPALARGLGLRLPLPVPAKVNVAAS
ncbi:hypothetical protein AB7M17_006882 [Bradyrhizobium sp. USDA 377]